MSVIEQTARFFFFTMPSCVTPTGIPMTKTPRMDYDRERCLVSDVRLKRYLRDYLEEMGHTSM